MNLTVRIDDIEAVELDSIISNADSVNWYNLSQKLPHKDLNEEFYQRFYTHIFWSEIYSKSDFDKYSYDYDFLDRYKDKIPFYNFSGTKGISLDICKRYKDKISVDRVLSSTNCLDDEMANWAIDTAIHQDKKSNTNPYEGRYTNFRSCMDTISSNSKNLSLEFLLKNKQDIKWSKVISSFYDEYSTGIREKLPADVIYEIRHLVPWTTLVMSYEFTEEELERFKDYISFQRCSDYQELSENFMNKYQSYLNWASISRYQIFSFDFLKQNSKLISYDHLMQNMLISDDNKVEFLEYLSKTDHSEFVNKLDLHQLSLQGDEKFITSNLDKIPIGTLCGNVYLDIDFIKKHYESIKWMSIARDVNEFYDKSFYDRICNETPFLEDKQIPRQANRLIQKKLND